MRRALGIDLRLEPLAQHLLGHELGLELGGALARGLELGLDLAIAVGQAGEAVILLLRHLLQPLDLVVEEAVPLAGLDQLPLGAGDGLVGLLRFEAQRLILFRDVAGALGLDGELVLQVGDDRLLVLHVEAQVLDGGFLFADPGFGLAQLRHGGGEIVRRTGMLAAEVAEFPAQGLGRLGLLPEHRFGFEKARLELRIGADEVVDRLAEEGEIVLEAADLLEPVDQVGEADADQLVLLADGIEGAVGAHDDRLALLRRTRPPA